LSLTAAKKKKEKKEMKMPSDTLFLEKIYTSHRIYRGTKVYLIKREH
jgi:hypothetical protein